MSPATRASLRVLPVRYRAAGQGGCQELGIRDLRPRGGTLDRAPPAEPALARGPPRAASTAGRQRVWRPSASQPAQQQFGNDDWHPQGGAWYKPIYLLNRSDLSNRSGRWTMRRALVAAGAAGITLLMAA